MIWETKEDIGRWTRKLKIEKMETTDYKSNLAKKYKLLSSMDLIICSKLNNNNYY